MFPPTINHSNYTPNQAVSGHKLFSLPPELLHRILPREDVFTYATQTHNPDEPGKAGAKTPPVPITPREMAIYWLTQTISKDPDKVNHHQENNQFLFHSLRKGIQTVFQPLLEQTSQLELGSLFEIAAIRNDNEAFKRLLQKAQNTSFKIPEPTLRIIASYGQVEQLQKLLPLAQMSKDDAKTLSTLAHEQQQKIAVLTKLPAEQKNSRLMKLVGRNTNFPQEPQKILELATLLRAGADINTRDHDGETSLASAASNGHDTIVQQLIQAGANLYSHNFLGQTPISLAAFNGHNAAVQRLIQAGVDINKPDQMGWTPIAWAASDGRDATVQRLIQAGADINAPDNDCRTPIAIATENGHDAMVQRLIQAGADINTPTWHGRTPICLAAQRGHDAIVQRLIQAGADLNTPDKDGQTPIAMAAQRGHDAIVQRLIQAGAELNTPDKDG